MIAAELNAYAIKQGFANGKQMMIAYLKAELKAARQQPAPTPNIDDVVIS